MRGEAIDHLLSAIGEMVTVNAMLDDALGRRDWTDKAKAGAETGDLKRLVRNLRAEGKAAMAEAQDQRDRRLRAARERLASSLGRLQDSALDLRVVPVDAVFSRLPRVARDLAQAQGKPVRLHLEGRDARVDKSMVEKLADPLLHMVRNAVDHGIETPEERAAAGKPPTAVIRLIAGHQDGRVVVAIADDGRGLDTERIRAKAVERRLVGEAESRRMAPADIHRFILAPGFSTAPTVTETPGRGVGMDVVNSNVAALGGSIDLASIPGRGTSITLRMPVSAAIQDALLVSEGGQTLAMPERFVAEIAALRPRDVQTAHGRPALPLRGRFLPLFDLGALLGRTAPARAGDEVPVVVLADGRRRIAIAVDRVERRQEIFTKDVNPAVAAIPGVGGAALLGDGRVVLILDGDDLFRLAEGARTEAAP